MASLSSFKVYTWRDTTSFIPCLIAVGEKASNSWCHILQGKVYTHFTLSYPSSSFILDYHTLPLHLSFCVSFTFAASITFEESQIFHSYAGGRFPSMWVDSINLRWFAFLKLDKRNTLCNTGNAFCINPVLEYIFENPTHHIPFSGYLLPNRCTRLFLYRFKLNVCWKLQQDILTDTFNLCR